MYSQLVASSGTKVPSLVKRTSVWWVVFRTMLLIWSCCFCRSRLLISAAEPMIRSDLWAGMPDWSAAGAAVAAGCSFEPVANRAELASSSAIAIVKAFFM